MAVTPDALAAWLEIPTTLTPEKEALLQRCIDAAADLISGRCVLPNAWTNDIELAMLMQAGRLYRRRSSPEGVAGFGEFGAVRVSRIDADIEALLAPYLRVGFA